MKFVGNNGQIEVLEDRVVITRKGLIALMTQGFGGEKTIPFSSISAVQFREPGLVVLGYIQFSVMGALENKNPASDENTVNFTNGKQAEEFRKLKKHMDEVLFKSKENNNDTKICPRCAETVKAAAKVCRYCNHEFDTQA